MTAPLRLRLVALVPPATAGRLESQGRVRRPHVQQPDTDVRGRVRDGSAGRKRQLGAPHGGLRRQRTKAAERVCCPVLRQTSAMDLVRRSGASAQGLGAAEQNANDT